MVHGRQNPDTCQSHTVQAILTMIYPCPYCNDPVSMGESPVCACGCDLTMLQPVLEGAAAALKMSILEMKSGEYSEAMEFAYESWGLLKSHEASAAGLIAAMSMKDPIEITRWLRRRALPLAWPVGDG